MDVLFTRMETVVIPPIAAGFSLEETLHPSNFKKEEIQRGSDIRPNTVLCSDVRLCPNNYGSRESELSVRLRKYFFGMREGPTDETVVTVWRTNTVMPPVQETIIRAAAGEESVVTLGQMWWLLREGGPLMRDGEPWQSHTAFFIRDKENVIRKFRAGGPWVNDGIRHPRTYGWQLSAFPLSGQYDRYHEATEQGQFISR